LTHSNPPTPPNNLTITETDNVGDSQSRVARTKIPPLKRAQVVGEVWPTCTSQRNQNVDDTNSCISYVGILYEKIVARDVFRNSRLRPYWLHRQRQGASRQGQSSGCSNEGLKNFSEVMSFR